MPNQVEALGKAVQLNMTKQEGSMAADCLTAEFAAPHWSVFVEPHGQEGHLIAFRVLLALLPYCTSLLAYICD